MTAPDPAPPQAVESQQGAPSGLALAFAFAGGPLAWFLQEAVDYGLFSLPCFPSPARRTALPEQADWIWVAGPIALLACLAMALAATLVAWRLFARSRTPADPLLIGVEHAGNGRTRFLSFWGMLLGGGFSVVILANLVAMLIVPPCAL